jgi:hypothetical protein
MKITDLFCCRKCKLKYVQDVNLNNPICKCGNETDFLRECIEVSGSLIQYRTQKFIEIV